MKHEIEHIVEEIKRARARKSLSQRELSERSGIPQAQISKIENGTVDLRLSSLVAMARALELDVQLVPRKAVPAVKSVVRNTQTVPMIDPEALVQSKKALEVFRQAIEKIENPSAELTRLRRQIRTLQTSQIPIFSGQQLGELTKQLGTLTIEAPDPKELSRTLRRIRQIQSRIDSSSEDTRLIASSRPAYSLDEEDDDA